MANVLLVNCNALAIPLADNSVQMVATSPPYYGLRDYGTARWEGGDETCDHNPQRPDGGERADRTLPLGRGGLYKDVCGKCGAVRIDKQIGLEQTPEEYVAHLVEVFREVKRVLRDDGVLFLNLGDSYWGGKGKSGYELPHEAEARRANGETFQTAHNVPGYMGMRPTDGKHDTIKPKDLIGIPWRVAFALQADGWWLRSDIIWAKPNPMPESVRDRPTKSHEYVFLLTKSSRYYWDQDAVREPHQSKVQPQKIKTGNGKNIIGNMSERGVTRTTEGLNLKSPEEKMHPAGRNLRTVWNIATAPYKGAHFATWPPKLVEPMIKAGSSEKGCCPVCGKAWVRVVEHKNMVIDRSDRTHEFGQTRASGTMLEPATTKTIGWHPACEHEEEPVPCVVLDPFAGSGTTLMVARQLGRNAIGLDLSFAYLHDQARIRLKLDKLAKWST